jgi:hypothetical protein
VGETTGGGFETLGGDKTHCFISRNKKLTILKRENFNCLEGRQNWDTLDTQSSGQFEVERGN